ncbi:M20 metallopeptidase family protein [Oceanobacillus bengalensis]|uniref:Amidohydrolase n=1 Tax=Oceanobacillus bengalensis TaxID=1435466 RepID=A0A494YXJ5_9BACI|nr:M20 family metallopeptidase [Oceanobacillus bengalensis]RKQ14936.1 amidohydrolase [Oceanobacillus bengalensis]
MDRVGDFKSELIRWRRHLHQYPELSFQEVETAKFVANILNDMPGMKVEIGVGYPTSVIGTISSGNGPTIAIRADMDALPIQEENRCSYRSQVKDVMHACGHDAHTTIALGAAHILSMLFRSEELQGTVKFFFQPAEEHVDENGLSGAGYMVRAGVLDQVDAVIALHMDPENKVGEVKIHDGYSMANVDVFQAKIRASGGHGAYPYLGTDSIWMLSHVLPVIYGITGRLVSPLEPAVISIGKIHAGVTNNVIPSEVEIHGTIRSYDPTVRKLLMKEMEKAFSLVNSLDGMYELSFIEEDPALFNHPEINRVFKQVIGDLFPHYQIINQPFGLGGEDFAHMTQKVPGAMFFLGCAVGDETIRNLHTPNFDIDENVLEVGTSIFVETVQRLLKVHPRKE